MGSLAIMRPGTTSDSPSRVPALTGGPRAHVYNASPYQDPPSPKRLPRLHTCAYKGDVMGVLECITAGDSVHETVTTRNQHFRIVHGITPLFLAAQRGHTKVCKLLVENGANPNQPSFIENTTELCTPAEVASLNLNFLLARYLRKQTAKRREEDTILEEDEADRVRQQQQLEDRASMGGASASGQQRSSGGGPSGSAASAASAAHFMANIGDLGDWDPKTGEAQKLDAKQMKQMMKKNKLDLLSWRPDIDLGRLSKAGSQPGISSHRQVAEGEMEQSEVQDHSKVLNKFLCDLDLAAWDPAEENGQRRGSGTMPFSSSSSMPRNGSGAFGSNPFDEPLSPSISRCVPAPPPDDEGAGPLALGPS